MSAAAGNGAHGSTTTPTNTDADAGLYRTFAAIADLKPHPQNYRTHTDEQLEHLAASIREHGVYRNVVVSWDGVILAGHGVVLAAAKLGRKMVPIVRVPFDSGDPRAVKLLIGDNEIGQLAGVDDRQLADLLQTISESDLVSLVGTGYDADRLASLIGQPALVAGQTDPDDVPPERATDIQRGDLFTLGRHRLLCGDATSVEDRQRLIGNATADVVLTDPPYGMGFDGFVGTGSKKSIGRLIKRKKHDRVIGDQAPFDPGHLFTQFATAREMFLWGADYYAERIPQRTSGSWLVWDKRKESQADAIGSEFELCWSRENHKRRVLRHEWFGFLSPDNGSEARHRLHPTQKPTSLMVDILEQWGRPDDVVVDLYLGSGTTLIACEQLRGICYGMEILPAYCQAIIDRWEAFTGQKAQKVGDMPAAGRRRHAATDAADGFA